jgi:hypothetical protein
MADGAVGVSPDVTGLGPLVDTDEITVDGQTVNRQRIVMADPSTAAGLAKVANAAPGTSDYGLVVRMASPLDSMTGALETIDYVHHEVHAGSSFRYYDVIALGNGASQAYLITVPDTTKWPHLFYFVEGLDAGVTVTLTEGADRTGTTAQTPLNRNRNSLTAATTLVHKGYSGGTTDGATTVVNRRLGQNRTAGSAGTNIEIILKRNTKYVFTVTNLSTSTNNVQIILDWYEHG